MGVPLSQMWTVASTCCAKIAGVKRYPLVMMLEPLFRCNLACAGCGKIQFPADILRRHLTPEQCFQRGRRMRRADGLIPGGEPLLHPQIDEIVAGLVARKKYIYLCTNALKLEECSTSSSRRSISPSRSTWTARATSTISPSVAKGTYDIAVAGNSQSHRRRLPRDDEHDAVRSCRSAPLPRSSSMR